MKVTRVHQEDKEAAGGLEPCRCLEIVFLYSRGTPGREASLPAQGTVDTLGWIILGPERLPYALSEV